MSYTLIKHIAPGLALEEDDEESKGVMKTSPAEAIVIWSVRVDDVDSTAFL